MLFNFAGKLDQEEYSVEYPHCGLLIYLFTHIFKINILFKEDAFLN